MFKPLLSAKADINTLTNADMPVIATPKIDGIRCCITEDGAVSRRLELIPNRHIQAALRDLPVGWDGELLTYTDGAMDSFNRVQSKVMRADGEPEFVFWVFDNFRDPGKPYYRRLELLNEEILQPGMREKPVRFVPITWVHDVDYLRVLFQGHLSDNWEGTMIRVPDGVYKHGRATLRSGILSKLKVIEDDEAVIVGYAESQANTNEATVDRLGRTKRSGHKAGRVGKDTLGSLTLRWGEVEFNIGTGMDDATRAALWAERESLPGQLVTFEYQGVGVHGRPRFPSFKGIRDPRDIS